MFFSPEPIAHEPFSLRATLKSAVANILIISITAGVFAASPQANARPTQVVAEQVDQDIYHRTISIDGFEIAYREAGDPNKPTVLLLHGFPTSTKMFRNLIPELAQRYHILAPDYPGYGASAMPSRHDFEYSFANFASIVDKFVVKKGVSSYSIYLMDFGAPVGFRLFAKHPERVTGFIIQNGNAYDEGLRDFWKPIKAYWAGASDKNHSALNGLLELDAAKWQHTQRVDDVTKVRPDAWQADEYRLTHKGTQEIQLDMLASYVTNILEYPKWQKLFRKHQPPALILWGKNDRIFPAEGAHPYKRDLENVEFHMLDTGYFALEEYGDQMADEILDFLDREVSQD